MNLNISMLYCTYKLVKFGSTFSPAHRLVFCSDTICNSQSLLLTDAVHFDSLCIVVSLTVFKSHLLERGFHTLIRNISFLSPIDIGSHKLRSGREGD